MQSDSSAVRPPRRATREPEPTASERVTEVGAHDATPLGAVLARAFRDNPLNQAVIRGNASRRLRSNLHGMETMLDSAFGRATILGARSAAKGPRAEWVGGLVALPPLGYPLPAPPVWAQLASAFTQGFGVVKRWGEVFHQLDQIHPVEPHWYLSVLGVDPDHQGSGHGGRMISRWLETVDAEQSPAYLETDRRENVSFYSRVGFRVLDERKVLGVDVWRMWRVYRVSGIEMGQMPEREPHSPGQGR